MKPWLGILLLVCAAPAWAQTPRHQLNPQTLAQAGAQHHTAVLKLLSQAQARQQVWQKMQHCRNTICNLSADAVFYGNSVRTTPAKLVIRHADLVKAGVLSQMFAHEVWRSEITTLQGRLQVNTQPGIPLAPPMRTYTDTLTL